MYDEDVGPFVVFKMPFSDSRALVTSAVTMAHDQQQRIASSPLITPGKTDGESNKNSNSFYRHNSPSSQSQDLQKQLYGDGEALTTRSAFEITSVSNAPPDGEDAEGHASKDAEELKRSLLEVDDSIYYRVSTSSGESVEAINDDSQISLPNNGTAAMTSMPNLEVPSNPSPKLFDPTGANGPQASGASRFRRINNYQCGRWFVTDIFEPEERSDSEMKMAATHSTGPKGDVQVGGAVGGDSNSLLPNIQRKSTNNLVGMDTQAHTQDGGHLHHSRSSSEISNTQDINLREQFVIMDKQSSTAESIVSLSRTGSLSSKSVDEEERGSGDIDDIPEPVATQTPDLPRPCVVTTIDRTHVCSCEEW